MFTPQGFDPSKMDPKVMMQLSRLIQDLPQDKLLRMQTLMHNMMAGFDVRGEMEELEKSLPPGFREQLFQIMGSQNAPLNQSGSPLESSPDREAGDARLTVLRGVANGQVSPEDALRLLFSE